MARYFLPCCLLFAVDRVSPMRVSFTRKDHSSVHATAQNISSPSLYFGPTANLKPGPLVSLVEGLVTKLTQWDNLRQRINETRGALHLRILTFKGMDKNQQKQFAKKVLDAKLRISIEGGGALCGEGAGVTQANSLLKSLESYLTAGGPVHQWLLESIYSRTRRQCPMQTLSVTTDELSSFSAVIHTADLNTDDNTVQYLYDALPHYSVNATTAGGRFWSANTVGTHYNMELGTTLRGLHKAMSAKGVPLMGYWADCPYEYSRDYPNASAPIPGNAGFLKLQDTSLLVRNLSLKVAKTFNSGEGGQTSDRAFFQDTMHDWMHGGQGRDWWDAIMVETWYKHPADAIPETKPYTTAYTALSVFETVHAGDDTSVYHT